MRLHLQYLPLISLLCLSSSTAQDTSHISPTRLAIVGGVTAGAVTAIHLYQQQAWWQGTKGEFWFRNDWEFSRWVDKCGHMYGTYVGTRAFSYALQWSGFERRKSVLYGAMLGLGFELYVETEDGSHNDYGFSPGDAFADITGAAFPLAQEVFPVLENFTLKWSYWPSKAYLDALKSNQARAFIDDYDGQIYWLALDPHFLLSKNLSDIIPAWLGISFGIGVTNYAYQNKGDAIYYVSLDYNFRRIRTESEFLKALFAVLDYVHFPAPALRTENGKVSFGLFY